MHEIKNRKQYGALTQEILQSIPDKLLEIAIIDNIRAMMDRTEEDKLVYIKTLSNGQQAIYSMMELTTNIFCEGLEVFFHDAGEYVDMSLTGLKLIGADSAAMILEKAIVIRKKYAHSPDGIPSGVMSSLEEEFESIDPALRIMKVTYIRSHLDEFTKNQDILIKPKLEKQDPYEILDKALVRMKELIQKDPKNKFYD